ncbi:hypothetical protein D3C72_2171570 [compost metagenome]
MIVCTITPASEAASRVETRTRIRARVFGSRKVQSGVAVESMISCVRRSRSRQTNSPE